MVHPGDRGPTVAALRQMLGIPADGIYGPATGDAVRGYQMRHGLLADGLVGLQSWTVLLTAQPPTAPGVPSPVKLAHP